jgi:WD40 repeat protein
MFNRFARLCRPSRRGPTQALPLLLVAVMASASPATAQEDTLVIELRGSYLLLGPPAFSPDSKRLAAPCFRLGAPGDVKLWDVATGKEHATLRGHAGEVLSLAFAPDGKTLASGGSTRIGVKGLLQPGEVKLWDLATGKERLTLKPTTAPQALFFGANGKTLIVAQWRDLVTLWDVAASNEIRRLEGEKGDISSAAVSADGTLLAVSLQSKDGMNMVQLWETANGKLRSTLKGDGQQGIGLELGLSPDGKILADSSIAGEVRLWDVASGKETANLKGHPPGWIHSITFAPDGKLLGVGARAPGKMGELRLWNVSTGTLLAVRELPAENPSVCFSPNGRVLAATSGLEIRLWDVVGLQRSKGAGKQ